MPKAIVAASKVAVLGRQGERVADDVLEAGPRRRTGCCATSIIAGRDVDAEDPAAGLRPARGGRPRPCRCPVATSSARIPGRRPVARTRRAPPARLLERRDDAGSWVVDAGDPVEHRPDLGGRGGVAGARSPRRTGGRSGGDRSVIGRVSRATGSRRRGGSRGPRSSAARTASAMRRRIGDRGGVRRPSGARAGRRDAARRARRRSARRTARSRRR